MAGNDWMPQGATEASTTPVANGGGWMPDGAKEITQSMPGKIDMRSDTSNVNTPEGAKDLMGAISNPVGTLSKAITGKTLAENIGGDNKNPAPFLWDMARKGLGDATEGTANLVLGGGFMKSGNAVGKVAKGVEEGINSIKNNIARTALNPEFRSTQSTRTYGQDAKRVMQNMPDIVGHDIPSTLDAVNNKEKEVGQAIGDTINNHPNANVKLDASQSVLKPFSDKIAELNKQDPDSNSGLIKRLKDAQQSLIKVFNKDGNVVGKRDLQNMTSKELFDFRRSSIDPRTRYTGSPSDDKDLNSVFQEVKSNIKNLQNENMPELKPLNQDYGDLHAAGDALKKLSDKMDNEGLPKINWKDIATGGFNRWIGNPINRINMARWLYSAPKAQIQQAAQNIPGFTQGVRQSFGGVKNATLVTTPKGVGGPNPVPSIGKSVPNGLPEPLSSTARKGVNPPGTALPSPKTVGRSPIPMGGYVPPGLPESPLATTQPPKYGTDNANLLYGQMRAKENIPLHPSESVREFKDAIYAKNTPEVLARNMGIKPEQVDNLADIKGLLESSEKGTNSGISYKGGRQNETFHWGTQSNVPDFLKDKYTTTTLSKMLEDKLSGGKVTTGQSLVIKKLLKHFFPNS